MSIRIIPIRNCVSIHAPRTGGDHGVQIYRTLGYRFNPRPPARGATGRYIPQSAQERSFNPRPPHGGRRTRPRCRRHDSEVSIHAPRTGGDDRDHEPVIEALAVSIHAPRTGGDLSIRIIPIRNCVSIHAPRTGGDSLSHGLTTYSSRFNPRPPHGGRQKERDYHSTTWTFQSTPPARGATQPPGLLMLEAGCFNPRPPHGGRPSLLQRRIRASRFQSTPPARGATCH